MIIRENGQYETCSLYPNTNWYIDEQNCIIDETTEQGKSMMQTYIDNYPLVIFTRKGELVTSVSVIELERPIELTGKRIELIKNELDNWEYIYVDMSITENQGLEEIYTKLSQLEQENAELKNIVNTYFGGV